MKWRSVAPILTNYNDDAGSLANEFDLGRGVTIGPASRWPIPPKDADGLGASDLVDFDFRRFAFAVEYEDGIAVDRSWRSREPKVNFQTAGYRIHYANLALWITRITPLAHRLVFHQYESAPGSGEFVEARRSDSWDPILCAESQGGSHLQPGDLELAKTRFQTLYGLGASGTVAVTIRLLLKTLSDGEAVSRFVGLWTCIEALVGPEDPGETTHQLAERFALFVDNHSAKAFATYRQLKKDYGLRSRIVHGLRTNEKDEKEFPLATARTEERLRLALGKIGDDPSLAAEFNGGGRESFLKQLPFRT